VEERAPPALEDQAVFHLEHKLPTGLLELPESVALVDQLIHRARWLPVVVEAVAASSVAAVAALTLIQRGLTVAVAVVVQVT
jgi:hypothetical protein